MPTNAATFLISRRLAAQAAGHRLPRNRRVPRPLHPTGLEREYYMIIIQLIAPFFQDIRDKLLPRLPEIIRMHKEETRTDSAYADMVMGYSALITRTIGDIKVGIGLNIPEATIRTETEMIARRTARFNRQQVERQFKSVLGINPLLTERWLEPKVSAFVEQNVSLIKSIPEDCLKRVEQMVRSSVERGVATSKLEQDIIDQFGVSQARGHLIARDQISKFNGKLHELRQREAGVSKYIWSTSKDERVRDKHRSVDGRVFSWDDPPPVGNNGERLHPGEDYQCRCVALPMLEEFV